MQSKESLDAWAVRVVSMPQAQGRQAAADPLLLEAQQRNGPPGDGDVHRGRNSFSLLTALGFCFLTFNSVMAVCRSQGDHAAIAFVGFSYLDLLALFYCLRRYEEAAAGSQERGRLKVAVWILTTALTVLFSYKVAAVMPPAVAVVVWLMAFATVAGGFYAFFLYNEKA